MWLGNNPNNREITLADKVYDWLSDTARDYTEHDYYCASLFLDYSAWKEQCRETTAAELRQADEGFFESEEARERCWGRISVAALMCGGNFRKKAPALTGAGNNGKSGFVSRLKHVFRMRNALWHTDSYRWVAEATAEHLFNPKSEINVSLAEALTSKIVILEEGIRIKSDNFKKFTGGPGSSGGARKPYGKTTQSVINNKTPRFAVNLDLTFDTGVRDQPADAATLGRIEVIPFRVTNYPSLQAQAAQLERLLIGAKKNHADARAHSVNELRMWDAAAARGLPVTELMQASIEHHRESIATRYDEPAARAELCKYHRVGDNNFANSLRNNNIALTECFMYMAYHCRRYQLNGGEDSLIPLEVTSVAESLAAALPDTLEDKLGHFFETHVVYDLKGDVLVPVMMDAYCDDLERSGEPKPTSKLELTVLALAMTKIFNLKFLSMPLRCATGHTKVRPAYEKCTRKDLAKNHRTMYCRCALAQVATEAEVEAGTSLPLKLAEDLELAAALEASLAEKA
mmetsp:Transcript_17351/g.43182  ORF Transcript_17351/g.43182 Transcript_17351/m.43182 type:complete len:516 (+) Transcript_17351:967-2514(+)